MASHVMMNQLWCRIPNAISAKNTYLPIAQMYVVAFQIARMGATMKVYRPSDQFGQCISKNVRRWTCLIRMRTAKPADVEYRVAIGNRRVRVRRKVCEVSQLSCLTGGFCDTASLRSQQASQHGTAYQKEITLPKRRCPRRCKPERDNGANDLANQTMLQ